MSSVGHLLLVPPTIENGCIENVADRPVVRRRRRVRRGLWECADPAQRQLLPPLGAARDARVSRDARTPRRERERGVEIGGKPTGWTDGGWKSQSMMYQHLATGLPWRVVRPVHRFQLVTCEVGCWYVYSGIVVVLLCCFFKVARGLQWSPNRVDLDDGDGQGRPGRRTAQPTDVARDDRCGFGGAPLVEWHPE